MSWKLTKSTCLSCSFLSLLQLPLLARLLAIDLDAGFWTITTDNLTELKETHLGTLSPFARSPSTSTITEKDKDKEEKGQPSTEATTPTTESAIGE
jgi:hypothetical protein